MLRSSNGIVSCYSECCILEDTTALSLLMRPIEDAA